MDIAYVLRLERDAHFSEGLYDWSQVQFAYNSNHMEGSTITEDQAAQIYHANSFIANKDQQIRPDDSKEMQNHFRLFNYMLDTVDQPLSLEYIIKLQAILKDGTSDEHNPLKVVGGFKKYNNVIHYAVHEAQTSNADEVADNLQKLINNWENKEHKSLSDYALFHYQFESIHPFSDGNGRVGRILLFKERCRDRKIPFIIREENRAFYIRGLQMFEKDPNYLVDTLGQSLDEYTSALQFFYGKKLEKLPVPPKKMGSQKIKRTQLKRQQRRGKER